MAPSTASSPMSVLHAFQEIMNGFSKSIVMRRGIYSNSDLISSKAFAEL